MVLGKPPNKLLFFLMKVPLRKGGGKALPLSKKITFFPDGEVVTVIKLGGGGGKGINDTAIKKRNFFSASLCDNNNQILSKK